MKLVVELRNILSTFLKIILQFLILIFSSDYLFMQVSNLFFDKYRNDINQQDHF